MKFEKLLEALVPSQYRDLVKKQKQSYGKIPDDIFEIHKSIFGDDEHRVYFDFNGERITPSQEANIQKRQSVHKIDKIVHQINVILAQNGYIVDDINKNRAYKFIDLSTEKGKLIWSKIPENNKNDKQQYITKGHFVYIKKNEFSIIKLLASNPELQKEYESYYQRVQSKNVNTADEGSGDEDNYLIVISRHAYDIAGMSTDRNWSSCMNIDSGINKKYVVYDVEGGNLVSYLIKKEDTNITNPVARVTIKKYKSNDGNYILFPEKSCYTRDYSEIIDKYVKEITSILVNEQKERFEPDMFYKFVKTKQYHDHSTESNIYINKEGGFGILEKDKKIIDGIFKSFNDDIDKVSKDQLSNIDTNRMLNDIEFVRSLKDYAVENLSEDVHRILDKQPSKEGALLLSNGISSRDVYQYIRSFVTKTFKLEKNDIKIKAEKLGDKYGDGININEYIFTNIYTDPPEVVRKYVIKDTIDTSNKDYLKLLKDYLADKIKIVSEYTFGKKEIKIAKNVVYKAFLTKKNMLPDFIKWVQNEKLEPNLNEKEVMDYYFKTPSGDLTEDAKKEFDEKFYEAIKSIEDVEYVAEKYMQELFAEFIVSKIHNKQYNINEFITLDQEKKKPIAEVKKDYLKYHKYNEKHVKFNKLLDFILFGSNFFINKKIATFFGRAYNDLDNKDKSSTVYKTVSEMLEKDIISKDDIKSNSDFRQLKSDQIEKVFKDFYAKYKSYLASLKIKKTKSNLKEDLINRKIAKLKRI